MPQARMHPHKFWSAADDALLRRVFPHQSTDSVAALLGRTTAAVASHARAIGLTKTRQYRSATTSRTSRERSPWTPEALRLEAERARSVALVAQTITGAARVEADYARQAYDMGACKSGTVSFLQSSAPRPGHKNGAANAGAAPDLPHHTAHNGDRISHPQPGVTQHRLRG